MFHPLFKNIRILLYYFAIWILISGIHFVVLMVYSHVVLSVAIADSLVFNILFALLAIPVWYVVRFSKTTKGNLVNILINHITSAAVVILLWIGLGLGLMHLFFADQKVYVSFLYSSILWRSISGVFFYSIVVLIYYITIYYNNLQERLISEKQLMETVKQAELDLLKSQINPHFLFNSLNSISSLTITNPEKAQEMIIKLSDFLRYSISQPVNIITTLRKELENIRRYLDIEQVRFGVKLVYNNEIPDNCFEAKIPAMILQPLYENAVKHGVYESTERIDILTKCGLREDVLEIVISNNFDSESGKRKGAGIGLKNIRERLKLIYKNEQLLKIIVTGNIFEVKLFIPQNHIEI